ncbi:MAG TPA: Uma2 family endonuclease [Urbifossiella sp.]|nr:Uma2 family endonuclease [Urbifossiella sp.]
MAATLDISRTELEKLYARLASEYCSSLPLEHFMESTDQSTQRKITLESLDLVTAQWPEFQVFSELLILYPLTEKDLKKPTRVCPDNMVIVHDEPIVAKGSFNVPLQPVGPALILEYVSTENKRKDYVDNRRRYANDLKVPYYLQFEPEAQKLTVFRLSGNKYVAVKPNADGRLAIPPLKLEVAIRDSWVRFWFKGELLPLPGEMMKENEELKKELARLKSARNGHS